MSEALSPFVKICGLTRRPDAEAAAAAGASFGGVILAPGGRRTVAPEAVPRIFEGVALRRVGVFVDASLDHLRAAVAAASLDVAQLHGDETPEYARALREGAAAPIVWKAVRPRDAAEFLAAVERFAGAADALLLDGWSPGAHGGTGTRFPWEEVAAHRDRMPDGLALVVAGGLSPENVDRAVRLLRPAGVDVSSGVERSPGVKDPAAIASFLTAVRSASAASSSIL